MTDALEDTWSYTYDALGRLETVADPLDSVARDRYDAAGNLTQVTLNYDAGNLTSVTDPLGNLETLTYPGSETATYAYDALYRLTDVVDWDSGETSYTYDSASRLTGVELPNAVISTLTYDDAGRLLSIEHEKGAQTLSSFDYTYDDVGNRTQAIDVLSSSTTIDYTYDPLYRLTEAEYSTNEYFTYTYDEVGNRLTQETQAGANEYSYDAADRLTEVDSVSYTWDDSGNLLDDGVREYTYDHANRLTQVDVGNDTYEFLYNGLGDRLRQTVNSTPTTYALDLNAGLTQVLDDGLSRFLYGLGRIGEEQSGGWQYHLGDALASVRQLTNASGTVTLSQSFEPFGSVLTTSGLAETPYGFTGEWTDATALVHLRARYYDPAVGRFLSRDPFPGLIGNPTTRHPYAYAYGNPLRHVDPSGQFAPLLLAAGAGAAAGGAFGALDYMLRHPGGSLRDYLTCGDFWRAVGVGATAGAVAGLVGWMVPTLLPLSGGLGHALLLGAVTGSLSAGAAQITANWLTGKDILAGVPRAMVLGGATGIVTGGLGYGIRQWMANRIAGIPPSSNPRALRGAMGSPPRGMTNPQAHHGLPWEFREWFAGPRRGLNANDIAYGRWVEGTPPGQHQVWSADYAGAWSTLIEASPSADKWQVLAFLSQLMSSGKYR